MGSNGIHPNKLRDFALSKGLYSVDYFLSKEARRHSY